MEPIKMYGSKLYLIPGKKRRGEYYRCENCNQEFYVAPCYIKKVNQRNERIKYCSPECYDRQGENNSFWGRRHTVASIEKMTASPNRPRFKRGPENPNFVRFGEEYGYTGKSRSWWIRKLLKEVARCEMCGFDNKRALSMHHKDRNNKNNIRNNLILLCWNCHVIEHYKDKSGIYIHLKDGKQRES